MTTRVYTRVNTRGRLRSLAIILGVAAVFVLGCGGDGLQSDVVFG